MCLPLLRAGLPLPILGVCLGFQALAQAHGGEVAHAPEPVHGRLSAVEHAGHALFRGMPSGPALQVVRYHSLEVLEASLPPCLEPLAWTAGGHHALQLAGAARGGAAAGVETRPGGAAGGRRVLMALRHASLPQFGVQFHPESIGTTYGAVLLQNFWALAAAFHGLAAPPRALPFPEEGEARARRAGGPHWQAVSLSQVCGLCMCVDIPAAAAGAGPPGRALPPRQWASSEAGNLDVCHRALPGLLEAVGGSEGLFWALFGGPAGGRDTFWLDSAATDRGRFSFMGGRGGPLWRRVLYKLPPLAEGAAAAAAAAAAPAAAAPGTLTITGAGGRQEVLSTALWPWLEAQLRARRCSVRAEAAEALPFDFWGGFVGYLGYELKAECGSR